MITIRPVLRTDAHELFTLVYQTSVTDTLIWDGPASFEELENRLQESEQQTRLGQRHNFTIIELRSNKPIGMISMHPDAQNFRGDIGLWLGEPYHGKNYGTLAVRKIVAYGFEKLGLQKIEAEAYIGNWGSRRIFEKNGFSLEGTIRWAVLKRGQPQDDWLFGLIRPEYEAWRKVILHLTHEQDWQAAQRAGEYMAASLAAEGFIHCSRPEQVLDVANRFYPADPDLIILWIELDHLQPEVRWETADGDDFPHIYGPINLDAVTEVNPFKPDADGRFRQFPKR